MENWIYELGYETVDRYKSVENGKVIQHKIEAISDIRYFDNEDDAVRHHIAYPEKYFIRYKRLIRTKPDTSAVKEEMRAIRKELKEALAADNKEKIEELVEKRNQKADEYFKIINAKTRITEVYDDKYHMFKPIGKEIKREINEKTGDVTYNLVYPQPQPKKKKTSPKK